ncbi:MAG: 4'-phosphopantetheinyl transferase superfamily protein, partial [Pseudobutyrivibrio sp.]|nr:4'-phosphopantetheinyl transferase superfamily protein [Pseudobutyrivibrio sp.]
YYTNILEYDTRKEQLLELISPVYADKYRENKRPEEALQELAAGYLLRRFLGIDKENQISYLATGKPFLTTKDSLHFNLSHSGDYVALALSDSNVGVDLEKTGPVQEAVVKKVFPEEFRLELEKADKDQREETYYSLWTRLEALLKLEGTGFVEDYKQVLANHILNRTFTKSFALEDGYVLSVAGEAETEVTIHRVSPES